jgi:WhiB family redox-sensing transcriptional regulator
VNVRRSGPRTPGTTQIHIMGTTSGTTKQNPVNARRTTSGTTRDHSTAGRVGTPLPLGGTIPGDPQGRQNSRASDYGPGDFPRGDPQALFVDEIEPGAFLRALVDAQPAWRREAECRDMGTAVFFPIRGQSNKPGLAVCSSCPVKAECLAEALAEEVDHGIRGGLTARARAVTEAA